MGKCKIVNRGSNVLPFIEYIDEFGNSYYVDILSKPWFYFFVSFRIFFPLNAYQIDSKMKKNDKKQNYKYNWIYMPIGIGFSGLVKIIFEQYAIDDCGFYSNIYQLVTISFTALCVSVMCYNKKKMNKSEKLVGMNKVTIKPKISWKGVFHGLLSLVFLYGIVTLDFSSHTSISIYDVLAFIGVGIIGFSCLFVQWTCLEFSSKDVKPIE